jgi:hypothetical protein
MHIPQVFICGQPGSTVFFHIISQRYNFPKKKVIEHEMCFLFFLQLLSETFLILRRTERNMIKINICLHANYQLSISDFNKTIFFNRFSKNTIISNLMNICPVAAELSHADGQTWLSSHSLFKILRTSQKMQSVFLTNSLLKCEMDQNGSNQAGGRRSRRRKRKEEEDEYAVRHPTLVRVMWASL